MNRRRIAVLLGIGAVAGLFSSVFGVGGGVLVVPLLMAFVSLDTRAATATSLAAIVITSVFGTIGHGALGDVEWTHALLIGVPAMLGVTLGVAVKRRLSSAHLTLGFAGLMVVVAALMAVGVTPRQSVGAGVLEYAAVALLGVLAGGIAGLFGVGGGVVFVPALTMLVGLSTLHATATSLLAIAPVAALGTWRQRADGEVRWREAAWVGAGSAVTALVGSRVAHDAPGTALRLGFAAVLVFTAVRLTLSVRAARRAG
ncbi:MAG: sulfite exporter TauE/SafE family protein [Thermoleophilia bacterium]